MDELRLGEFQLLWSVNMAGHRWIMERDLSRQSSIKLNVPSWPGRIVPPVMIRRVHEPLLAARWVRHDGTDTRQYAPLRCEGLFRTFSRLGDDFDAMREFADEYGLLTRGQMATLPPRASDGPALTTIVEPQAFWQTQVRTMARLVWLWDQVRGPKRVLEQFVSCRPSKGFDGELAYDVEVRFPTVLGEPRDGPVATISPTGTASWLLAEHQPEGFFPPLFPPMQTTPDPVLSAHLYVATEVNQILMGHARPVVLPWKRGQITIWLDSLLAGMYAQFALEVAGRSVSVKVCEAQGCGKPFVPKPRQRFCSDRCRNRDHYRKHPKRP